MPEDVKFGVVNFKKNAYIYIEDQSDSDSFFIIRQGKVVETRSTAQLTDEDKGTVMGVGDFFGVLSCMAKRPRIGSVVALEDTSAIVVKGSQFESLLQKMAPIAMKIIRSFSKQLRFYDSHLTKLTFQSSIEENPCNLFRIGEYYFANKMFTHAAYAYLHYIKFCPDGGFVPQAKAKLVKINPKQDDLLPRKEKFFQVYSDNQIIFLEHEPGAELYIIQEGKVKIAKMIDNNEVLLAVLKKGDIFGEMSILENKPRSASAIAFGEAKLMAVTKANFEPMVQAHPEIAKRIIELLSERIWLIYKQLSNILINDPVGRLYDAMFTQLQKSRIPVKEGMGHTFDFGTDDLLKFIGLNNNEGKIAVKKLFDNDKTLSITDGKIFCKDVSNIHKAINVIKRNQEIELKKRSPQASSPMY
jgi:CRP/FNR family transcriptional regulator